MRFSRPPRQLAFVLTALLMAAASRAQPALDPKAIEPYVEADTLVVAHIDLSRVDFAALDTWLTSALTAAISDKPTLDSVLKDMAGTKEMASFAGEFKK